MIIKDALTLDVALNPDFSQVESDEPQVTANQRYEVYFPEKRPFFIENAGYFATPINLFFSRRIADPEFGARVTGKLGRWAIGAMAMDDRAPGQVAAYQDRWSGHRAGIGVLRLEREFGKQSYLGMLLTRRDFGWGSNEVFSADTRLRLNQNWFFTGQAVRSETRLNQEQRVSRPGAGYYASLNHGGRHLSVDTTYVDYSPDFEAGLGYIPRVDIRRADHLVRYQWKPESGAVTSFGPGFFFSADWDHNGRLQDWVSDNMFRVDLKGQTYVMAWWAEAYEYYGGRGFRERYPGLKFSTERWKKVLLSGSFQTGHRINYYPAAGIAPFPANTLDTSVQISLIPAKRMRFDQTYIYSRLGMRTEPRTAIFNNHILRSKLNYQFTRALSLRAIVDYNGVLANPDLIRLERTKNITKDLLLTYLLNPGTALYAGYTDRYENLALTNTRPTALSRSLYPDLMTARQFFVKLSYLFRF